MYITIPGVGGSYEIFRIKPDAHQYDPALAPGWYWWACWPFCLPDGDAVGPYESENVAMMACQDYVMSDA